MVLVGDETVRLVFGFGLVSDGFETASGVSFLISTSSCAPVFSGVGSGFIDNVAET